MSKRLRLPLLLTTVVALSMLITTQVFAVGEPTHRLPNNGAYQQDGGLNNGPPLLVVGRGEFAGHTSYQEIYVRQGVASIDITVASACDQNGIDLGGSRSRTIFWFPSASSVSLVSGDATAYTSGSGVRGYSCDSGSNIVVRMSGFNGPTVSFVNDAGNTVAYRSIRSSAYVQNYSGGGTYENSFLYQLNRTPADAFVSYGSDQTSPNYYTGLYNNRDSARRPIYSDDRGYWNTSIQFAQECGTGTSSAQIKSFDNDENTYQSVRNIKYRLLRRLRANPSASFTQFASGSLLGGQNVPGTTISFSSSDQYIYRVDFSDIQARNAIQVQLPFRQINAIDTCNRPPALNVDLTADATCDRVRGTAGDPDYRTELIIRFNSSGASATSIFTDIGRGLRNFIVAVPTQHKSNNQDTVISFIAIRDYDVNGNLIDTKFLQRNGSLATGDQAGALKNLGICNNGWDYEPEIDGNSSLRGDVVVPSGPFAGQTYRQVYAGDNGNGNPRIQVDASITNQGNFRPDSADFDVAIRVVADSDDPDCPNRCTRASGDLSYSSSVPGADVTNPHQVRWNNNSSIAAGDTRNYYAFFAIDKDHAQDDRICFEVGVNRHEGESANNVTAGGFNWSNQQCWTFLRSYNIQNPGLSFSDDTAKPGDTVTVNFSAENTDFGNNTVRTSSGEPPATRVQVRATTSNCEAQPSPLIFDELGSISGRPSAASGYGDSVDCTIPNNVNVGDDYCFTVTFVNVEGLQNGYITNTGNRSFSDCINITSGPYFGVDEGSVFAGMQLGERAPNTDSAGNQTATIIAASASTATGDWVGGVSEFAALALGEISGFSSTMTITEVADTTGSQTVPDTSLTFANQPGLGNFGFDRYQQTDLYQLYVDPATNNSLSNNQADDLPQLDEVSGQTSIPNTNSLLNGGTEVAKPGRKVWWIRNNSGAAQNLHLADSGASGSAAIDLRGQGGIDVVLLVSGDLWIGNNIVVFDNNGYADIDDIPSLTVIVEGEIHLGSQVTRLDGTYITAGDFNTCDSNRSFGPGNEDHINLSTQDCTAQLTVNGLVLADKFLLKRTHGSTTGVNANNTEPAEQFIHAPEVYLSPPPSPFPDLPGVSSLVDLPPLF